MAKNPYEALERIAGYEFTGAGGDDDKTSTGAYEFSTGGYEFAGGLEFTGAGVMPASLPPKKPAPAPARRMPMMSVSALRQATTPAPVSRPALVSQVPLSRALAPVMAPIAAASPPPAPPPFAQVISINPEIARAVAAPPPPPFASNALVVAPPAMATPPIEAAVVPVTSNGAPMMALAPAAAIGTPAPMGDLAAPSKPLPGNDAVRSSALVSASRNGSQAGRAYQPQPINRGTPMSNQSPQLRETQPNRYREYPLGFATPVGTPVPAGATTSVPSQPQVVFRGVRIVVQSTIAPFFLINDIKVGKNSQLVSSNPIPADVFISTSVGVSLQMDTAQPGMTISIEVFNTDVAAHPFNAALIGSVME